jgi:replicative DNA helicase
MKKPTPTPAESYLFGKTQPQNNQAEEVILGAAMIDSDAVYDVCKWLDKEDMYDPRHQHILEAIKETHNKSSAVDILTITNQLMKAGTLESIGGPAYLAELTNKIASAANLPWHIALVKEKATMRKAIKLGGTLIEQGYNEQTTAEELYEFMETELFRLTGSQQQRQAKSISSVIARRQKELDEVNNKTEGEHLGLSTQLTSLDNLISGLQAPDLLILAARPGMGKTSFALTVAYNLSVEQKKAGIFFSLEMSDTQLVDRMVSMDSEVDLQKIRDPRKQNPVEKKVVATSQEKVADGTLWIDDTPGISITEIRSKVMRLKREHDIQYVMVDYLQLMNGTSGGNRSRNREQEVSEISRKLKELAKEAEVPIIALSQLSRAVETRGGDKRPQLSDLRESGSIEQDSDIVMFLYRPWYYNITEDAEGVSTYGLCEVIVAKNRHGSTETIYTRFRDSVTKFVNWTDQEENDAQVFAPINRPAPADDEDLPF